MRFMKGTRIQKVLANREGQLSLVFMLVIAVALIFFAVTLNWARISSMKTMTTVASNVGVAKLASSLASYGENPVQSSLEGKRKKCAFSGMFAKLLMIIIIVAIIIMSYFCPPCVAMIPHFLATVIVALVAATLTLVLQATVVEPGITGMWNKLQQNISRIEDQFGEAAIQVALERAVSDMGKVNDVSDYDMNGKYCQTSVPAEDCQKISRFAYYYTKRLIGVRPPSTALLQRYRDFRTALGKYVGDDLGVVTKRTDNTSTLNPKPYVYDVDDTCCLANNSYSLLRPVNPQYCNSCCITKPLREPLCGVGGLTITSTVTINDLLNGVADPPPIPAECLDSQYLDDYPLSYDPLFCMRFAYQKSGYTPPSYAIPGAIPPNSPYSLVTDPAWRTTDYAAVMGVDDSVPTWARLRDLKPNWPDLWPSRYSDSNSSGLTYYGKDSEGRFFPFLWFMRDTQVKINGLNFARADSWTPACHWCKITADCKVDAIDDNLYWGCDPTSNPLCSPALGYDISVYNPASPLNPAPTAPAGDDLQCVNFFEGFVGSRNDACRTSYIAGSQISCGTEKFATGSADREIDNVEPLWKYLAGAIRELEGQGVYDCPKDVWAGSDTPPLLAGCQSNCPCDKPGLWRTGNDRYCSSDPAAPYFSGNFVAGQANAWDQFCPKFKDSGPLLEQCISSQANPVPDTIAGEPEIPDYSAGGGGPVSFLPDVCNCGSVQDVTTRTYWRDDDFDLTIKMMSDLANTTRMILMDRGEKYYKEVDQWGQKAQRWTANIRHITDRLYGYKTEINGWKMTGYPVGPSGNTCYTSAWCLPTRSEIALEQSQSQDQRTFVAVGPLELQTSGAGTAALVAGPSYASPENVVSCLQFNEGNQGYFDGLSSQYEAPMSAKRDYMMCAYSTTLNGYDIVVGSEETCWPNAGVCCEYPRSPDPDATKCVPNCAGYCGVPATPLVPRLINGLCGVDCTKNGAVTKRPNVPECFACGTYDCPTNITVATYCPDDPTEGGYSGPCGGTGAGFCTAPKQICPALPGYVGVCCDPVFNPGCPMSTCRGPDILTCVGGVGTCPRPPGTCTGVCQLIPQWPGSGCVWTNGCWTGIRPGFCDVGCVSPWQKCDPTCPIYCDVGGQEVAVVPSPGLYGPPQPNPVTDCHGISYSPMNCSYTWDCTDDAAIQPQTTWRNNLQRFANAFCQAKQGTNADAVALPPPLDNPICNAPAPPPNWDAFLGFRRTLERDWHRTLTTKSLYAPVDTSVPLGETWANGGVFALFYFTSANLPYEPDTVRGWDTDGLVGDLPDTATAEKCADFYNHCLPLIDPLNTPGIVSSLGNYDTQACEDAALMCIQDPVFVFRFLEDSSLLADRQNPKLVKRKDYLNMLISQADSLAMGALPADGPGAPFRLDTAAVQTTLTDLINTNEAEKARPPDLPNWAAYVWQSDAPPGETVGYWHAVKVEVLLPRRCFVNGVRDFDGFDCCEATENKGKFPWIRTYNTNWGQRRCYEMWDEEGCVKVRVSRYDEDHTLGNSVIKFLSGTPLWKFLYRHPMHSGDARFTPPANCADPDVPGAFITYPGSPNEATCAAAANTLIQQGYISETCARYQLDPEDPDDPDGRWTYNLVFRDCRSCCFNRPRFHKLADD